MLYHCRLKDAGITCKSSIGSTPSCSHPVKNMAQLSEVHPGNYAFYGAYTKIWINLVESHVIVFFPFFFKKKKMGLLLCFRCAAVHHWLMQCGGRSFEGFDPGHWPLSSQESAPGRLWMVGTEVPSSDLWPSLCFSQQTSRWWVNFHVSKQVLFKNTLCPQSRWSWSSSHWICCYWRTSRPQVLLSTLGLFSKLKLCVMKFWWKWFPTRLASMTQEHGRVEPISGPLDYSKYPLGTMLTLIPYHVSILAFWGVKLGLFGSVTALLTLVCCFTVLCNCSDASCVPRVLWWSSGGEVAPNTRVVNSSNVLFLLFLKWSLLIVCIYSEQVITVQCSNPTNWWHCKLSWIKLDFVNSTSGFVFFTNN